MTNENRKHKDSVFTDLFYSDQCAEKNLAELYNALYDESVRSSDITRLRLDDALFMNYHNDVAFSAGRHHIVLCEHQSTINNNMPLRCLLYIAREYESYFPVEIRYKRGLVTIPTPEFFVFYNGTEDYPVEASMKLSDAFAIKSDSLMLELEIRVININPNKQHPLLQRCPVLRQYSEFIQSVRDLKGISSSPLVEAVKTCIRNGVLKEYLERKGSEVINMLIAEYDYDTDIKVQRQESWEDGMEHGLSQGLSQGFSQGLSQGRHEERVSTLNSVRSLIQSGALSLQDAVSSFHLTEEELKTIKH